MRAKTIFIIVGPTAVGKTSAAIYLAKHLQTKIISADSRQCFRELDIGVAKPTEAELKAVHHYFINSHSIQDMVNAALYEKLALGWAEELFKQNENAVMVGGTGLYVRAFCEGLDEMPLIDPSIRKKIQEDYQEYGLSWLQGETKKNDAEFYAAGEILNPQRLMRALEVKLSTGRSVLDFRTNKMKGRGFNIKKIGLQVPKAQLHKNINDRVDGMISKGLVEEVKNLMPYSNLNALQTVGYSEIFEYLCGKISLDQAIEEIKKNTRHYAKRQMTWFKKDGDTQWIDPADYSELIKITQS